MTDLYTLTYKEVSRFLRVWKQTLLPAVITTVLYLAIFWKFIWDRVDVIEWVNYIDFIFPGLLMMSVILASYQNTSSSFFGSKFQKSIEELFVSPINHWKILLGFCLWAMLRGMIVAGLVFLVGALMTDISIQNISFALIFVVLTSLLFALLWLFNGLYAQSFDDISVIPTFVITPLTYLGWVFYPIAILWEPWQFISQFNPILYMVNGLRYSFIWISDINVYVSLIILIIANMVFVILLLRLLKKWYGIRT